MDHERIKNCPYAINSEIHFNSHVELSDEIAFLYGQGYELATLLKYRQAKWYRKGIFIALFKKNSK